MFVKALILMIAAEGLSLLAFNYQVLSLPLLVTAGITVFIISIKNPEWGIYILFGELFFGSRGHLLEYDLGFASLSLRLVIFMAVFGAWLLQFVILRYSEGSRDSSAITSQNDKFFLSYSLLLAAIGFAIINGYLRGHGIGNIFNDANGYLYLLILPAVLSVITTREQVNNLLQILAAAILVIAGKTFLLFVWFSFGLPGVATAYHWIISQGFGEITGDVGKASRIFMQSQFYALVGLFIFIFHNPLNPPYLKGEENTTETPPLKLRGGGDGLLQWLVISASILSVLMSLSRSFWLGAVAGAMFATAVVLWRFRAYFRPFLGLGLKLGCIAIIEIGLLYGMVAIGGNSIADAVSSRGGDPTKEAAGGARLLLLPELLSAIKQAPILGAGFGKTVTYKSQLPDRVTPANPDGEITSYAFEWGYLDTLLKVGIVGLVIYLLFIARIFKQGFENFQFSIFNFQTLGLMSGLAALVVLNVTTPYLNHPLGIGYLIFVYSYLLVIRKTDGQQQPSSPAPATAG